MFFSLCAQGIAAVTAGRRWDIDQGVSEGGKENKVSDSDYFLGAQGGRARMVESPPLSEDCVSRKKRREVTRHRGWVRRMMIMMMMMMLMRMLVLLRNMSGDVRKRR